MWTCCLRHFLDHQFPFNVRGKTWMTQLLTLIRTACMFFFLWHKPLPLSKQTVGVFHMCVYTVQKYLPYSLVFFLNYGNLTLSTCQLLFVPVLSMFYKALNPQKYADLQKMIFEKCFLHTSPPKRRKWSWGSHVHVGFGRVISSSSR